MPTLTAAVLNIVTAHLTGGAGYGNCTLGSDVLHDPSVISSLPAWSKRTDTYSISSPTYASINALQVWFRDWDTANADHGGVYNNLADPAVSPCQFLIYDCYLVLTYSDGSTATVRPTIATVNNPAIGNGGSILGGAGGMAPNPVADPQNAIDGDPTTCCTIWRTVFRSLGDSNVDALVLSGFIAPNWLLIDDPGLGITDRTGYLKRPGQKGAKHSWTRIQRQRGQATVELWIPMGDSYTPTQWTRLWLYDHDPRQWTLEWGGLIQKIEQKWVGRSGYRKVTLTCVSFESVLDTVYNNAPRLYQNKTCGYIFTDLFNNNETGAIITLGTISDGQPISSFFAEKGAKLSDLAQQLAETSLFTWFVDPQLAQLNFVDPTTIPAPFTLQDLLVSCPGGEISIVHTQDGADFRDRQAVKVQPTAIGPSEEFFVGAGQTQITLRNPVAQVKNAYATLSTCNTATGSFSGQPTPGDTFRIQVASGAWQAAHIYALGGSITVNGYRFTVTFAGRSGGSIPAGFATQTVLGDTVTDNTVIWTCQGAAGLANGDDTYTAVLPAPLNLWAAGQTVALNYQIFNAGYRYTVSTNGVTGSTKPTFPTTIGATVSDGTAVWTCDGLCLDNAQWGQFVIDPVSLAQTCLNFVNAINADPATQGVTHSLPTWECNQCNALYTSGTSFTLQQKAAGTGWVAQISTTSSAFAWSGAFTSGGTSPQGSLGPGQGATISLQVYEQGTSIQAPGLSYTKGSNIVNLATPANVGSNINIEYIRADQGIIEVEDTQLVALMAALTHGTGKYYQLADVSSQGVISTSAAAALQLAQQALAAYKQIPLTFEFVTFQAGLFPGQALPVSLVNPSGGAAVLNATWVVQEVNAELLGAKEFFGNYGHYRYTIRCVNLAVTGTYLDYWKGLGGGSSGGGGGVGALVPTSGGSQTPQDYQINFADDETLGGSLPGTIFTLAHTPIAASLLLFVNGVLQLQGTDYTISGNTITFTSTITTQDWIRAWYRY